MRFMKECNKFVFFVSSQILRNTFKSVLALLATKYHTDYIHDFCCSLVWRKRCIYIFSGLSDII